MNGHELFQNIDEKKIAQATLKIWTKLFFDTGSETHTYTKCSRDPNNRALPHISPKPTYTPYFSIKSEWYILFNAHCMLADGLVTSPFLLSSLYTIIFDVHCFDGVSLSCWWPMRKVSSSHIQFLFSFLFNVFINNGGIFFSFGIFFSVCSSLWLYNSLGLECTHLFCICLSCFFPLFSL